ncbi:MAG: hypothetical protein HOH58_09640 [Opitutaceae bacterium]|nr:hypothetical protein [Opitutaceae bacterium]
MLQGYRPNGADAENEAFAEALAQASRDPALSAWFEREQEFDATIAAKLSNITAPAGLRDSILAGTKLSSAPAEPSQSRAWWLRPWAIGLAAAAAVALAFTVNLSEPETKIAALPGFDPVLKVALADYGGAHDKGVHANDLGNFGAWLMDENNRLGADVMPVNLDELRQFGCRKVNVAGHEVFEVCFQRESGWYHVFIAPRESFDAEAIYSKPMFHESGEFIAASWADDKFAYLVSGTTELATLRGLL